MDSTTATNKAFWEVFHNLPASNTNNMNAETRSKYEQERTFQLKQKEGKK